MTVLSEYLNDRLPPGWTKSHVVEALAGAVDRATVYRYLSGKHPRRPSDSVLQAFASILPESSMGDLRVAAGMVRGAEAPWIPPSAANRLTEKQRRALDAFIVATVEAMEIHDASEPDAAPLSDEARADVRAYLEQLHASGREDLAERVATSIAPRRLPNSKHTKA